MKYSPLISLDSAGMSKNTCTVYHIMVYSVNVLLDSQHSVKWECVMSEPRRVTMPNLICFNWSSIGRNVIRRGLQIAQKGKGKTMSFLPKQMWGENDQTI